MKLLTYISNMIHKDTQHEAKESVLSVGLINCLCAAVMMFNSNIMLNKCCVIGPQVVLKGGVLLFRSLVFFMFLMMLEATFTRVWSVVDPLVQPLL